VHLVNDCRLVKKAGADPPPGLGKKTFLGKNALKSSAGGRGEGAANICLEESHKRGRQATKSQGKAYDLAWVGVAERKSDLTCPAEKRLNKQQRVGESGFRGPT